MEKIIEVTIIVEEDKRYCSTEIQKLKEFIIKSCRTQEKKDERFCITLIDRLRFVHCLFEEEVLFLYEDLHTLLTREELDARNLTDKKETYKEALTKKFNDIQFIPHSSKLGHIHSTFSS